MQGFYTTITSTAATITTSRLLLTVKNSKQKSLWLSIETNGRKTDLLRFSRIFVDSLLIDKVLLRFLNTFHLHTH